MSNNNIDRMLSMRAQTLGGNNYGATDNNNNQLEIQPQENTYEDPNSLKNILFTPLNICLFTSTVVILFIIFLLTVIYK